MKHKIYWVIFTLICSVILVQTVNSETTETDSSIVLNKAELEGTDNLMIVAHPDDEIIWGASHLMNEKYFVVCLTNGNNVTRRKEFESVLQKINTPYIMLNYPDKVRGKRDQWKNSEKDIKEDIKYIMNFKKWNTIATHNPKGEYGHLHHKKTSEYVREEYLNLKDGSSFYYFGNYEKKKNIDRLSDNIKIPNDNLQKKFELMKIYRSQSKVDEHLKHIYPYENWIKYKRWK